MVTEPIEGGTPARVGPEQLGGTRHLSAAQFVHAHPTQNESLGEAHLALAGKPLHTHD